MSSTTLPTTIIEYLGRDVGVAAPGSAPTDPAATERGIQHLRSLGLNPVTIRNTFAANGYLCGTDEVRADELNQFLRDPDIRTVFCLRGGYGSSRILRFLDYEAAAQKPTLIVGYSDITAIQLALLARSRLPSLSGPMVSVEFAGDAATLQQPFWDLLGASQTRFPYELVPPNGYPALSGFADGSVSGKLIGGNLSVLSRLVGTEYLPDMVGAILFLEDVAESPYLMDAMLEHLQNAGILEGLGGIALGSFTDSDPPEGKPSLSMQQVFADYLGKLGIPVARDLCYGHFPVKNAVPIGLSARLDVKGESASLTLQDSIWTALSNRVT